MLDDKEALDEFFKPRPIFKMLQDNYEEVWKRFHGGEGPRPQTFSGTMAQPRRKND